MRAVIVGLVACAAPQPAPVVAPVLVPGPGVLVPVADEPRAAAPEPDVQAPLAQPPEIKLKLGHFRNTRRGVAAVIDLTGREAKLRYDGTDEVLYLLPTPGQFGRTDYLSNGDRVVLQVWKDSGRVRVYVTPLTDGVDLWRDADAEPL